MKRVQLTHGTARVVDDASKELIEALDKMSRLAYTCEYEKPTPEKLDNTVMELALRTLKSQMEDAGNGKYDLFLSIINNALNE